MENGCSADSISLGPSAIDAPCRPSGYHLRCSAAPDVRGTSIGKQLGGGSPCGGFWVAPHMLRRARAPVPGGAPCDSNLSCRGRAGSVRMHDVAAAMPDFVLPCPTRARRFPSPPPLLCMTAFCPLLHLSPRSPEFSPPTGERVPRHRPRRSQMAGCTPMHSRSRARGGAHREISKRLAFGSASPST